MSGPSKQPTAAKRPRHRATTRMILAALCTLTTACDPPHPVSKPAAAQNPEARPQLAAARIDLAATRLAANAPDEALALLVPALEADPQSAGARTMVEEILAHTRWHLAETTLDHRLPVDRISFADPSSLWVCLGGGSNTTVRWNLESPHIESVLFPVQAPATRSLVFDLTGHSVVVERAGVTLLCNAQTLKPIRDLGPLPEFANPSAVIVFSADGLLLAHPTCAAETNRVLVWHLRDSATGEIIRSSDPIAPDHPRPLAAFLDRKSLRVLHADGSLFVMPVSPVDAVGVTPPTVPISLLDAQFSETGAAALTLLDPGPHRNPEPFVMPLDGDAETGTIMETSRLLERFPWSRHPGIWTGLWRDPNRAPLLVVDRTARFPTGGIAPIRAASAITALAVSGDRLLVGETCGTLTLRRTLPVPLEIAHAPAPAAPDAQALAALRALTEALAGGLYDEDRRSFADSTVERRLLAFGDCDFTALRRVFPTLDFSPLVTMMRSFKPMAAAPEALLPLWDRLARADPSGKSWPVLLEKSADLSNTAWHQSLTAAVLARASKEPVKPECSPWLAPLGIERIFGQDDASAIVSAIESSGGKGAAAAKALELALASTHPEWIEASLAQALDLPPLLRRIAVSRGAWLRNRKADALTGWPAVFPDLTQVRLREDWDGWEQADFSRSLEKLSLCVGEELAAIDVPANPNAGQRKEIAARLNDPATLQAVGRERFAKACLKAALAFAAFKDETETTFTLAARARDLGEAPAPCLRAEAMALTALGDYQQAHGRWITLITEHPVANQLPGDYAEASYTAFENADPRQAMAILTTGLHRFPHDANFALRAGWVALLTGNAERAYRFLLTGQQIGFPQEKLENAIALLAIAAGQTGASEDAAAYYQDLIRLDPAWENPDTLESLEWPEELKASLRQLVW